MLTAEIKINGKTIAFIEAQIFRVISDKPGDFIGDRATVCAYRFNVYEPNKRAIFGINCEETRGWHGDVEHDSRFGWQGLIHTITGKIMPIVVETVSPESS